MAVNRSGQALGERRVTRALSGHLGGEAAIVTHNRHVDPVNLINPRRACAASSRSCVCLFVSLFVGDYSRTTGYEAAYERYQQLQCYKGQEKNVALSLKRLRSGDMA